MKRTPLERKTPLVAKTGLRRSTPLQQAAESTQPGARALLRRVAMAVKAPKPKLTPAQKRPLLARSDGQCEIGASGCMYFATDVCHRRGEKSGGRHGDAAAANDRLSNVLHGCRACHTFTGMWPRTAELNGWRLLETADPLASPVNRRGVLVLLDDEGGITDAGIGHRVA
jgi:hypothetical protein